MPLSLIDVFMSIEYRVLLAPGVMARPVLCMVMHICGLMLWEFFMMNIEVRVR